MKHTINHKSVWWQSQVTQQLWRTAQRLSLWMLLPLGLFFWVQGCSENRRLEEHPGAQVQSVLFSSDGTSLYGEGSYITDTEGSGLLWAWDAKTGRRRWQKKLLSSAMSLSLSTEGRHLLTINGISSGAGSGVTLYDAASGDWLYDIPNTRNFEPLSASLSPHGDSVLIVCENSIERWDVTDRKPVLRWRSVLANEASPFTNDPPVWLPGQQAVVVQRGLFYRSNLKFTLPAVEVWSLRDGKKRHTLLEANEVIAATVTKGTDVLTNGALPGALYLHDSATGQVKAKVQIPVRKEPLTGIKAVFIRPDGTLNARLKYAHSWEGSGDGEVEDSYAAHLRWNLKTGVAQVSHWHPEQNSLWLSPGKRWQAKTNQGNGKLHPPLVTLRDAETGATIRDFEGEAGWRDKP